MNKETPVKQPTEFEKALAVVEAKLATVPDGAIAIAMLRKFLEQGA